MPRRPDGGAGASRASGSAASNPRALAWVMALLRLFVGVKFLLAGMQKWDWIGTPHLADTLSAWAHAERATAFGWHVHFLMQTVLPHATLFTYLVVFGEIGVGLLLIFGLLTRLAALLGLVMSVNYLLATWALGAASQGFNESFIAMELAFLIVGAGRAYGLDARLARKRPRCPLW